MALTIGGLTSVAAKQDAIVNLCSFVRILRRGWPLIGALAIAGVVLAGGYVAVQAPRYEATTTAYLAANQVDMTESPGLVRRTAQTYAQVATSRYLLVQMIKDLHLKETAGHLADRVTAEVRPGTVVLEITASDGSPQRAADIANDIYRRLIRPGAL